MITIQPDREIRLNCSITLYRKISSIYIKLNYLFFLIKLALSKYFDDKR